MVKNLNYRNDLIIYYRGKYYRGMQEKPSIAVQIIKAFLNFVTLLYNNQTNKIVFKFCNNF